MELLNGPQAADCRNELRLDWHLCRGSFRQILSCAFVISFNEMINRKKGVSCVTDLRERKTK